MKNDIKSKAEVPQNDDLAELISYVTDLSSVFYDFMTDRWIPDDDKSVQTFKMLTWISDAMRYINMLAISMKKEEAAKIDFLCKILFSHFHTCSFDETTLNNSLFQHCTPLDIERALVIFTKIKSRNLKLAIVPK